MTEATGQLSRRQTRPGTAGTIRLNWMVAGVFMLLLVMQASSFLLQQQSLISAPDTIRFSACYVMAGFVGALLALLKIARFTIWRVGRQVLPVWFSISFIMLLLVVVFRLPYSGVFLIITWPAALLLLVLLIQILQQPDKQRFLLLPGAEISHPALAEMAKPQMITEPKWPEQQIDAIITPYERPQSSDWARFLTEAVATRIPIISDSHFVELQTGRVLMNLSQETALMETAASHRYVMIKRILDILVAAFGLVLLAPLLLLVGIIIRLESPGPALFIQSRIGLGGKPFPMVKFRSMRREADRDGASFAARNDSRITGFGRFIRNTRIDELPQLWNVLRGEMSLIGPRPEQAALVDELASRIPYYSYRHMVRPGITGWAQVMQGYADDISSTDVKLSYDLFYIKRLSAVMDFIVVFKTIKTILTGFGAR